MIESHSGKLLVMLRAESKWGGGLSTWLTAAHFPSSEI